MSFVRKHKKIKIEELKELEKSIYHPQTFI